LFAINYTNLFSLLVTGSTNFELQIARPTLVVPRALEDFGIAPMTPSIKQQQRNECELYVESHGLGVYKRA